MIPLKSKIPGAAELDELTIAIQAKGDAERGLITARINRDAITHVVKDRFYIYCCEILPSFVRRGESFWLAGEYAGEYALSPRHQHWTDDGVWLNVKAIGYTKKGALLKSNDWNIRQFNPAFIAKEALAHNPGKPAGAPRTGAPP